MYSFGKLSNISTLCHIWSYTCTFLLLGFWPVAIDLLSEAVIIDIPWGFQHCRSHGCSGDNQFDSEAAGPLKRPSSWGIVTMVAGFCQDAEGEWHNVYGVVDDISWRWLRYFHIAPFGIHLGFAWDWRYWTWLKIWVFRSPFVDWKWSEGPKTQDNSAVFCCEAAQLRCWVAWGTWKRDWNDLSAVSL